MLQALHWMEKMPEIPSGVAAGALCYDLMYGKQTPFMQWAMRKFCFKSD